MKESVQRAFSYMQANKTDLAVARDLDYPTSTSR